VRIKILGIGLIFVFLVSCQKKGTLYMLEAPEKRGEWFEPDPFGMAYIPRGSYRMGPNEGDVRDNHDPAKTVTVEAFWMDDTEITNNEYRQFVFWVRDSIARKLLGEVYPDFLISENVRGEALSETFLNWDERIDWNEPDYQTILEEMFLPEAERFASIKEIDPRKLIYDYSWIDYRQAAEDRNRYDFINQKYNGTVIGNDGIEKPIEDRSSFLMHESVPVYPDTLVWVRDFTYAFNEPWTVQYFSHVGFDDYPAVGVNWKQARAFCNWRTKIFSDFRTKMNDSPPHDFRLPTEAEWEYASRGGLKNTLYPWGSYYTRNINGCFVANFKPLRGNYVADSPNTATTMKVGSFDSNPYGLYDMAGNVAEWTSDAFYEAAYDVISDFNPYLEYNARPDDPPVLKRKVVRGGSWKDVPYFIQNGTRSYEYQDSTKSYIGFRCVRTSFRNELKNR
jgi:formylglycine-generating enzyme required for sulfatase activity